MASYALTEHSSGNFSIRFFLETLRVIIRLNSRYCSPIADFEKNKKHFNMYSFQSSFVVIVMTFYQTLAIFTAIFFSCSVGIFPSIFTFYAIYGYKITVLAYKDFI